MTRYQFAESGHESVRHICRDPWVTPQQLGKKATSVSGATFVKKEDSPNRALCGAVVSRPLGIGIEGKSGICPWCIHQFAQMKDNKAVADAITLVMTWLKGGKSTLETGGAVR